MTEFAIGQDSHAFEKKYDPGKPLVLGGYTIPGEQLTVRANSDGDVLLHALTNAISGITSRNVLGCIADGMCKKGITDSAEYLKNALGDLEEAGYAIVRISFSVEAKRPRLASHVDAIKESVARLCKIKPSSVGLTATSGEGLTSFGKGLGIQAFCCVTAEKTVSQDS